jgi:hypothetical protein
VAKREEFVGEMGAEKSGRAGDHGDGHEWRLPRKSGVGNTLLAMRGLVVAGFQGVRVRRRPGVVPWYSRK